jgi:hypothetical protein
MRSKVAAEAGADPPGTREGVVALALGLAVGAIDVALATATEPTGAGSEVEVQAAKDITRISGNGERFMRSHRDYALAARNTTRRARHTTTPRTTGLRDTQLAFHRVEASKLSAVATALRSPSASLARNPGSFSCPRAHEA